MHTNDYPHKGGLLVKSFNTKIMGSDFRLGAILVERGLKIFAEWSQVMIKALGEDVKDYLPKYRLQPGLENRQDF